MKVKATTEKPITLFGTSLTLDSVFIAIQPTFPIRRDIVLLNFSIYQNKDFYEQDLKNQIKTDIPIKHTQGMQGLVIKLEDNESQDWNAVNRASKEYFESLGYECEIESDEK